MCDRPDQPSRYHGFLLGISFWECT
jgi:hypothetical protein